MSRKHEFPRFRALGWIENMKNNLSEASDEQKLPKTTFPSSRMDKKHDFPRFRPLGKPKMPRKPSVVGRRQMKNAKKCSSSADEMKNTAKTARRRPTKRRITRFLCFPTLGKIKITRFLRFPTLGKSKTPENCISQLWESQKCPKTAFPNLGKVKNARKQRFPTLGKSKTPKNRISHPWESQKHPKTAFPPRPKNSNHPKASSTKKKILILHWLVDSTARVSSCFSRKKVHITFGGTKKYPYLCTRS